MAQTFSNNVNLRQKVNAQQSECTSLTHLIFDAAQDLEVFFGDLPSKHLDILLDPLIFT
jgi:hypothetical protein